MDEEIIEVIARGYVGDIWSVLSDREKPFHMAAASKAVDALRAEGFDIYRPGECELGVLDGATFGDNPPGKIGLIFVVDERPVTRDLTPYRLVPAERGE